MAVWHFISYLIPVTELRKICGCIPDTFSFSVFEDTQWWVHEQNAKSVAEIFNQIFGVSKNRKEGIQTWYSDSHSISMYFDSCGKVEVVSAKTDARTPSDHFLEKLIDAARLLDCVLYFSSQEIIPADLSRIRAAFERSVAVGFLKNPEQTLQDPIRLEFERIAPQKSEKGKKK